MADLQIAPPLLKTKLHIPHRQPDMVSRPRLVERLDEGIHTTKLTLISTPAGFSQQVSTDECILTVPFNLLRHMEIP